MGDAVPGSGDHQIIIDWILAEWGQTVSQRFEAGRTAALH